MVRLLTETRKRIKEQLMDVLRRRGGSLSTCEVAAELVRSWRFTKELLEEMRKQGLVEKRQYGKGFFWTLR